MIKEEKAAKNKSQEVDDTEGKLEEEDDAQQEEDDPYAFILRWVKDEDGRKKFAWTHYNDAMVEVNEKVKSSDTRTSVGDGIKEEDGRNEPARTHYSDALVKVDEEVKSSDTRTSVGDRAWEEAEMINGEEDDALLNERGESDEEDDSPLNKPGK
ncbi:hypothetical protein DY000_02010492 [Brassica cretica]|uniref:Uncharacterized protein n=1 Tax=Brassica cretica TaxID=69181 RepID=A0ABQ7CDS6_BRACR|nr:hypothetical protein DY000_02010492 [Brassica cretica]